VAAMGEVEQESNLAIEVSTEPAV